MQESKAEKHFCATKCFEAASRKFAQQIICDRSLYPAFAKDLAGKPVFTSKTLYKISHLFFFEIHLIFISLLNQVICRLAYGQFSKITF